MPEEKVKLDFNREIDFIQSNSEEMYKNTLVKMLKRGSSAESTTESVALEDLIGEIARSEGPVEVSESDLNLLEKNVNRIAESSNTQVPNWVLSTTGRIIQEGREKLEDTKN